MNGLDLRNVKRKLVFCFSNQNQLLNWKIFFFLIIAFPSFVRIRTLVTFTTKAYYNLRVFPISRQLLSRLWISFYPNLIEQANSWWCWWMWWFCTLDLPFSLHLWCSSREKKWLQTFVKKYVFSLDVCVGQTRPSLLSRREKKKSSTDLIVI